MGPVWEAGPPAWASHLIGQEGSADRLCLLLSRLRNRRDGDFGLGFRCGFGRTRGEEQDCE